MAVSKVLSIVLLGLFGAALANPAPETTTAPPTTPAGTGSTPPAGTGSTPPGLTGVQDYLSDADKDKVCKVPAAGPTFCATAGPADDFCSKLAASVNGATACCAAPSVCSFKVGAGAATTPAGTGPTAAGSTTPAATTPATTTTAATTPAGTGPTTPAGTGPTTPVGAAPTGPAVIPQPNTVYVSCNTAPAGFKQLKVCPNSKTTFVFPSAPAGPNPASNGSNTPTMGPTTTEY